VRVCDQEINDGETFVKIKADRVLIIDKKSDFAKLFLDLKEAPIPLGDQEPFGDEEPQMRKTGDEESEDDDGEAREEDDIEIITGRHAGMNGVAMGRLLEAICPVFQINLWL
jgi:hypothetical protein